MLIASFSKLRSGVSPAALGVLALLLTAGCRDTSAPTGTGGSSQPTASNPATPATPSTPSTPPSTPSRGGPLFISGTMTSQRQGIRVASGGAPVLDAVVKVNGFTMPYCCGDLYSGDLPEAVPDGGTLNLDVEAGGVKFEASREVIATPTITGPAEGIPIEWTDSVTLTWSSPVDPDLFEVCLNCWDNSIFGEGYYTLGSERQFKFRAGTLADFGEGAPVTVFAQKNGFIKSDSSAEVTADVRYRARAHDLIIRLNR